MHEHRWVRARARSVRLSSSLCLSVAVACVVCSRVCLCRVVAWLLCAVFVSLSSLCALPLVRRLALAADWLGLCSSRARRDVGRVPGGESNSTAKERGERRGHIGGTTRWKQHCAERLRQLHSAAIIVPSFIKA